MADNLEQASGRTEATLNVPCHPVDGFGAGYSFDHGGFIEVVFARAEWSALGFFGSDPGTQPPVTPIVALRLPVPLAKALAENLTANVKRIEEGRGVVQPLGQDTLEPAP